MSSSCCVGWNGGRSPAAPISATAAPRSKSLNLTLRIAQGTANLEDGRFEGGNVRVALGGSASIPARDFDINGTASLLAGNEAPPAFELPFFVQGSWDDPVMLPDTQALIRRSGAAAPLLNAVTDKRARDEMRSTIDRMMREGAAPGRRRDEPMPIPFEPAPKADMPVDETLSR